jgi:hypothetical protein
MYDLETYDPVSTMSLRALAMAARGLTYQEACEAAKQQLYEAGGDDYWLTASCEAVKAKLCTDCTVFNDPGNIIRLALTGTSQCPCPPPGGNGNGTYPPPPPSGDANMTLLALAGIAVVGALALAIASSKGKRAVMVAKQVY